MHVCQCILDVWNLGVYININLSISFHLLALEILQWMFVNVGSGCNGIKYMVSLIVQTKKWLFLHARPVVNSICNIHLTACLFTCL